MKRRMIVCVLLSAMLVMGGCGNQSEGEKSSEAIAGTVEASEEAGVESKTSTPTHSAEQPSAPKETEETKESQAAKESEDTGNSKAGEGSDKSESSKEPESGESGNGSKASQGDKASDQGNKPSDQGNKQSTQGNKQSTQGNKATDTALKSSGTAASQSGKKDAGKNNNAASAAPSQSVEVSRPAEHVCDFGSGTVTTAATCTSDGVRTYSCSCGKTKTETIPATGHSMKTETTPAACTEAGKSKTYCMNCGYVESEGQTEGAKGHSFGEIGWMTTPDCLNAGWWSHTCTVCGYAEGGNGEPLGHEAGGSQVSEEPGCDYYGTREIICSRCGGVLYTEDIPTIPHIDENGDGECDRCHGPA